MLIFMLSLTGMPPLAGFFGKFYLFTSALNADPSDLGLLWLVVVALGLSAVSLYYYLQVLKQIYIAEPRQGTGPAPMPVVSQAAIAFLALAVVVLGCAPDLLMGRLIRAIQAAGF
jgi:NADH-quinone oxidoreductase subunit N